MAKVEENLERVIEKAIQTFVTGSSTVRYTDTDAAPAHHGLRVDIEGAHNTYETYEILIQKR